jgi:hypothetical protein
MTSCLLKNRAIFREVLFSGESSCDRPINPRTGNILHLLKSNDMDKPKKIKNGVLLLGALLIAATALFVFGWLAEEMLEGDTQQLG